MESTEYWKEIVVDFYNASPTVLRDQLRKAFAQNSKSPVTSEGYVNGQVKACFEEGSTRFLSFLFERDQALRNQNEILKEGNSFISGENRVLTDQIRMAREATDILCEQLALTQETYGAAGLVFLGVTLIERKAQAVKEILK